LFFSEHASESRPELGSVRREVSAMPPSQEVANRHFLFVSGPFGSMTSQLGASLRRAGARCSRVLLNGGDVYDWGSRFAFAYRGHLRGWADWLSSTVRREQVTDLILYGDSNPYCAEAREVASALSLRVHVMEQGYFRPFWVTLERDGVNGNSSLPRDPEYYLRAVGDYSAPVDEWLPPLTPPAVRKLSAYHTALWLATPFFPRFRLHYGYSLPAQAFGHIRRYLNQRLFSRRHERALRAALDTTGAIFVGILQRPGDSQLTKHSPFVEIASFIDYVVASFARHAPAGSRLIFKAHPLDHGLERHELAVQAAARRHGVHGRAYFIDRCQLDDLLESAAGAVTINSTAGLSAIEKGLPTVALGSAIFNIPGLTHQGGLDGFWCNPAAPNTQLFEAFRTVVIGRTQIGGAYATQHGVDLIVPAVTQRLLEAERSFCSIEAQISNVASLHRRNMSQVVATAAHLAGGRPRESIPPPSGVDAEVRLGVISG
jgi:capsular polysaccharide export protein